MKSGKRSSYVHVSFDPVDEFVPRVPENRCPGENDSIPRICMAGDVISALNAMPGGALAAARMAAIGLKPIVHAYYLKGGRVLEGDAVRRLVPDAYATGEAWFLDSPSSVRRMDWLLDDPAIICLNQHEQDGADRCYCIIGAKLKLTPFTDNWDQLFEWFGIPDSKAGETKAMIRARVSFREFMTNFTEEQLISLKKTGKEKFK